MSQDRRSVLLLDIRLSPNSGLWSASGTITRKSTRKPAPTNSCAAPARAVASDCTTRKRTHSPLRARSAGHALLHALVRLLWTSVTSDEDGRSL